MRRFEEECGDLAPLETFDPKTFSGTVDVPQHVCNFVLSLALFYNDYKNLLFATIALGDSKPDGEFKKTKLWGAYAGMEFYAHRVHIGLLHELFELIRNSQESIEHPFMARVIHRIRPVFRPAWHTLVDVANGATPADEFGMSLLRVRNKVSFHYDPKEIFRGYKHQFLKEDRREERAFISRGDSMSATRFYFADAAALGYLRALAGEEEAEEVLATAVKFAKTINMALMSVVDTFIQVRGAAYRAFHE
jgi:hypothetical protein